MTKGRKVNPRYASKKRTPRPTREELSRRLQDLSTELRIVESVRASAEERAGRYWEEITKLKQYLEEAQAGSRHAYEQRDDTIRERNEAEARMWRQAGALQLIWAEFAPYNMLGADPNRLKNSLRVIHGIAEQALGRQSLGCGLFEAAQLRKTN